MGLFDKDKPKADFGNVQSGSSSAPDTSQTAPTGTTYTVKSGDSLSKIAKHEYGDAGQWKRIFEANKDQIKDPDLIHPGQELKIPPKEGSAQ
jgi:nucleoid-associated protein YgaU